MRARTTHAATRQLRRRLTEIRAYVVLAVAVAVVIVVDGHPLLVPRCAIAMRASRVFTETQLCAFDKDLSFTSWRLNKNLKSIVCFVQIL